ncbi:MAG TPA: hypothetical protein VK907_06720, partial [Phnomibacter sp.]|nr:hypothetical protein [Phnomibacter sp.]
MMVRIIFFLFAFFVIAAAFTGKRAITADDIPRVWTDAAMKNWELPAPDPAYSARPVSEAYYYSLPERVIYKSYPVYHPDHEPEGYWQWLHEQEPEIVWDESKLKTEADWIKAGEMLFDHPIDTLGAILTANEIRDPKLYEYSGLQYTKDGIVPFVRYIVPQKGSVYLGNLSCGMCHTRVM